MDINFRSDGSVTVCSVVGRVDATNAAQLKKAFQKALDNGALVVIDLASMEYIDSTGLGALVACLKYAAEAQGNVKLANLQPKPRMVFEITRAHKIFDIYDNLDEAVASYS